MGRMSLKEGKEVEGVVEDSMDVKQGIDPEPEKQPPTAPIRKVRRLGWKDKIFVQKVNF